MSQGSNNGKKFTAAEKAMGLGGGALLAGLLYLAFREEKPKAFISFAVEDARYRTYLVGQSKNDRVQFKMHDKSLHEPFSEKWKTQAREIIRDCDVVIVMIGKQTWKADGVLWEIRAALEEQVPIFGIHINKDPPSRVPQIMKSNRVKVIAWDHALILKEIKKAEKKAEKKANT